MTSELTDHEQQIWLAYLLGRNYQWSAREIGLASLLTAVENDTNFDRAMESNLERLERQIRDERAALASLEPSDV